ncbi:MAG: hypothetical protein ACTHJH_08130 [Marmoricola sp.]
MRLLLRANAHRPVGETGLELASSPDTAGREQWQWHLRLDDGAGAPAPDRDAVVARTALARPADRSSELTLSTDPDHVTGAVEQLEVNAAERIHREERELLVLVVGSGHVLVEGRHRLGELDAMVLEGDDPYDVSVAPLDHGSAAIGVARLEPVDDTRIAWVP